MHLLSKLLGWNSGVPGGLHLPSNRLGECISAAICWDGASIEGKLKTGAPGRSRIPAEGRRCTGTSTRG